MQTIAAGSTPLATIQQTAHFLTEGFAEDLGLTGGRIYALEEDGYRIVATFGEAAKPPLGLMVDPQYTPIRRLFETGAVVMHRDDPGLDPGLENRLGTGRTFAAAIVDGGNYVLSFDVDAGEVPRDDLVSTLNIVRLAVNQQLREERMAEIMEDARQIQTSILPRHLPSPGEYTLAARSTPAEIVGGDFYDFIALDRRSFDIVVADATGHGLPAALQVRDVFTGLRMGLSREYKLTRTLERLNRIIHRSRMATKFVSLFLAEIEQTGDVIYCCAGHPPALLVRSSGEVEQLNVGGLPLGPFPNARYVSGVQCFGPGDTLVVYTDGITETVDDSDEEFGVERLQDLVSAHRALEPQALVDLIFDEVSAFSDGAEAQDDRTVMVIQRRKGDNND